MTLYELETLLKQTGCPVARYEIRETKFPYIVYSELDMKYNHASGRAWREVTRVAADHYSKTLDDPSAEDLKMILLRNRIGFTVTVIYHPADKIVQSAFELFIVRELEA